MTFNPIKPAQHAGSTQLFQERVHDPYKSSAKLPTPTVCPECGAVYSNGRWQWLTQADTAHREMCPACHRIHDHFPAGYVKLEGEFLSEHRDQIIQLVRNVEKKERAEHPLQRIVEIADEGAGVLVTTTDVHLAHGIGEALHHAYKGELDSHYNKEEKMLRVSWKR